MQEWLMKVFSSIISTKTALIALITIILAITSWQTFDAFIISKGVPSTLAPLFILICTSGLAHIIVELVMYFKGGIVKWCKDTSERSAKKESDIAKQKHALAVWKTAARKAIPHLPCRQIEILMKLHEEKYVQYHRYNKDGISNLIKLNYIYEVSLINENDYLFAIYPEVFEVVDSYLKKQREELLVKFCEELTDNDIEFLKIFFDEKIPFGVPDTEIMQALVWSSGEAMITKGIIKSHYKKKKQREGNDTHIMLALVVDANNKLQELKGFGNSYRQEAELDLNLISVNMGMSVHICTTIEAVKLSTDSY
ncbi:hypothetical protein [Photobacterium carnosum]|uniref:hypothetical protein n=1 Tax=Photobacterium carnosum TaxID=2023717 RepID=UPI00128CED4F|nr:hypothetical protein [Photobacterium carnosum]KAE8178090.1 hypothetical protein CIT27_04950 [Photobacterium carnosum]